MIENTLGQGFLVEDTADYGSFDHYGSNKHAT
jgi:hypothetical protein